jgi:catechol 2,3-dioxygenase-like lactoylglutathione lyase family enzyme
MEQRISLVTLGVADVRRARTFYERLGWQGQEIEETVFFQAGGMALVRLEPGLHPQPGRLTHPPRLRCLLAPSPRA